MGNVFSASEIVRLGILIEQNGYDFYREAAAAAKSEKTKEIFEYLAKEEQQHEKTFRGMIPELDNYEPPESASEEYLEYLKALSREHVFTEKNRGKETAAEITSDMKALDLAIGFEKDSILLFHEMKNLVPEHGYPLINGLIDQEREHLRKLSTLRATL